MNDEIPDHESPTRRMLADAHGGEYVAYESLERARDDPDGALVLEGDYGGQIYLGCPVRLVAADESVLQVLLRDLDRIAWEESGGAAIRYERAPAGTGIAGGMGGGAVTDDIWVHDEFVQLGLDDQIRAVVRGERDRISPPA